jgi:hypothetical protein
MPLSDCQVAFCDSIAALEAAYAEGLPRSARIRSFSPVLLRSGLPNIEAAEAAASPTMLAEIYEATFPFSARLFSELQSHDGLREYALTVTRIAVNLHKVITKAACLVAEDFTEPRAVLSVNGGSAEFDSRINVPWPYLLHANPHVTAFEIQATERSDPWLQQPPLSHRLRLQGFGYVGYRLAHWLSAKMPSALVKRQSLILTENALLSETAFALALQGFMPAQLDMPPSGGRPIERACANGLRDAWKVLFGPHIRQWVEEEAATQCEMLFLERAEEAISRQIASQEHWCKVLGRYDDRQRTIILTNYPGGPEAVALANESRRRGLPFVAFQHGNAREICSTQREGAVWLENGVSDLLCTFNDISTQMSETSPFARGASRAVGVPRQYFATKKIHSAKVTCPITYISTALYRGNMGLQQGSMTDVERAAWEINLIEGVFSELPFRVFYKTYPSRARYHDLDPIIECAQACENIEVSTSLADARYILGGSGTVVTSCATSTLGWCLMSERPLCFIDLPNLSPLSPTARAAFEEAVFVFNGDTASSLQPIKDFLSQPADLIAAAWERKKAARKNMISQYITGFAPGAGKRAAKMILGLANERAVNHIVTADGSGICGRPTLSSVDD